VAAAPVAPPRLPGNGSLASLEEESKAAWAAYQSYRPGHGRPTQEATALLARAARASYALSAAKAAQGG
jgi:hypothetical protein